MKIAVVGSRSIKSVPLDELIPPQCTEIVSGGARGVDTCAREYAQIHGLKLTEFYPDYERFGRSAPLKRNDLIVAHADMVIAFWDGESRGTLYTLRKCRSQGKPWRMFRLKNKKASP